MMILVGLTERTGVFTYLALRVAQLSGGRPFRLVLLLALTTGVMSAFLDNLTTILLVVPVTLLIADVLRISPVPLVLIEILALNIGGTATLIGDPPNILIGTHVPELSFIDFVVNLAPVSIVTLLATTGLLYLVFRRQLVVPPERALEVERLDPLEAIRGSRHVRRSLGVLAGTIVGFFLHSLLHVEPAVVALAGATVLLLVSVGEVNEAFARVDWTTLFFFLGLFVMVGGLEAQGVLARVADFLSDVTGGSRVAEGLVILWGAALGSALVDNIPFTAAMIPVVRPSPAGGRRLRRRELVGACARRLLRRQRDRDRRRRQRGRERRPLPQRQPRLVHALPLGGRAGHAVLARDRHRLPAPLPAVMMITS